MSSRAITLLFAVLASLSSGTVFAVDADDDADDIARYEACLALAETNPDAGYDDAILWDAEGGGAAAAHCAAVALVGLQKYAEAARRLEALASNTGAGDDGTRAEILGQAGNAWMLAGDGDRAYAALTTAVNLSPDDTALYIDRARAAAMMGDFASAENDLSAAIIRNPSSYQALVLRAFARRVRENYQGARADCSAALALFPNGAEALTERGHLRLAEDNRAGARADFLAAIAADSGSLAAEDARTALAALDVHGGG